MSEPSASPALATEPISVILFAQALSTDTLDAVRAWRHYLDTLNRPYEIFLIQETGPEVPLPASDQPPDAAESMRIFTYERALGFREAFADAIRASQYPLLAFCLADKQYQPADLRPMLEAIGQVEEGIGKTDMVVGFRTRGQAPPWRVLLDTVIGLFFRIFIGVPLEPRRCWLGAEGWGRRWIARWIFGVRVLDPECPFRLIRREVLARLPIQSGGPFLPVEILAKTNHLTCYVREEPVQWTRPVLPSSDGITFSQDAWLVFREPDFVSPNPPCPTPADEGPKLDAKPNP